MGRSRDIADMLSKTELVNTGNEALITTYDAVDSAYVSDNSVPALAFYSTLDSLPVTSLTSGQQAYVSANNRLYISDGSGWYNKALIRLAPTMTLDPTGTITLATDGTTTSTVTIIAADSDTALDQLTYSVESDGSMLGRAVISQDSSVFTIRPLSEDSGATTGTFTLTFKTSDGTNLATDTSDFSLTFATTVDSSSATVLLMKSTGSGKAHEGISYQSGSDATLDIVGFTTSTGTPVANSFNPYREGGYSTYFDGTGDYISFPSTSTTVPGASTDFSIEYWLNTPDDTNYTIFDNTGAGGNMQITKISSTYYVHYITGGDEFTLPSLTNNEWHHWAIIHSSSTDTTKIYVDGTVVKTLTGRTLSFGSLSTNTIGIRNDLYNPLKGYLRDFRFVLGSQVYTSDFTPPTEPLTAISGTSVLACHLPYIADGSTNNHTFTVNGDTKTLPYGPYDYNPHVHNGGVTSDVGSTFLNTGVCGMAETTNHQAISNFGSGDFTIELWYYPTTLANYHPLYTGRANTGTYGQLTWLVASGGNFLSYASSTGSTWNVVAEAGTTVKVIKNTWNHLAYVRNGNTWTIYVNGVGEVVSTNSGTLVANTLLQIGYENNNQFYQGAGYISDYRIVKGSAVYTANFTPPTEPLTWVTNTTLLLNNKYDTYIYDAAAANKLRLEGDTQSTTAQRKFTTSSSVSFDGTGDYAYQENSELFAFGTGDFTVEAWIYYTTFSGSGGQAIVSTGTSTSSGTTGHWYLTAYGASDLRFGRHGSAQYTSGASSLSTSTWHHLAVAREGTTVRIFVDGTALTTSDTAGGVGSYDFNNSSGYLFVGEGASFSPANGYMQDLRITKGKARYTANFTPPTTEFEL